ncbi:putative 3-hydroxyisobutyrate dehydrogenase-like 1, mitochondrial [Apostasia shenzhenica]|uniref:Putative 3-hydroxyisobutyrate dehydrogenase-like 1, mitochondrial n=1 Tax=Apostasia shenzhenica TaxID=1088818 RepID=A0A2I0B0D0_9ASPA|nr:putative 3-hydroxyisobutyrate dehydrogenase-like 1, mitochondrial [Apostasia shenzhenica]
MEMEDSGGFPRPIRPGVTRVGWIGVGVMGAAMAGRILAAGYSLTVYARTPSKAAGLTAAGARLAASPAAVAAFSDVIFTMVSHPSDVRAAVLDPAAGALSALAPGGVLVDQTTSHPALAREIAAASQARGCWAVDAPVSGGDVGARNGKLAIFAGGEEGVIQWLSPIWEILGRATAMGGPGSGQSSKIANQIAVGGSLLGLSEALVFAESAGLDPREFISAVRVGAAGSAAIELWGERVIERDFLPGGFVEYMVKDLGMALEDGGGEEGAPAAVLPGAALCRQLYQAMLANGDGKMGTQGLITVIERINGK